VGWGKERLPAQWQRVSTAPKNKVTIVSKRHSGNLLAGIQKNNLDTGPRRYDELTVDSYLC
jgi:hypothetical protein